MTSSGSPRLPLILGVMLTALLVFVSSAAASLGDRTLRRGMSGDDVLTLQRSVTELGYPTPRYGTFTSRTENDILRYERSTGLTVDGVVSQTEGGAIGRRLREQRAREGDSGSSRSYEFGERTLRRGFRGGDVLTLQRLVTKLGYPTPRYGSFTSRTVTDMLHYERSTGLTADSVVSRAEQRTIARRATSGGGSGSQQTHVFPVRGAHSYGGSGSRFGAPRGTRAHKGQDIAASSGTPLVSVSGGTVSAVQYQAEGAGNYVVIRGSDRYDYVYMHMRERASVSVGQRVSAGARIGSVGATGVGTGPHLHFEMWTAHWFEGGQPFDPLPHLRRWDADS